MSFPVKASTRPLEHPLTSARQRLAISKPYRRLIPASTASVRSLMPLSDGAHVQRRISSDPSPEDFIMAINAEFSGSGSLLMTETANRRAIMFFFEINNEWQGTLLLASARLPNVCFQVLPSHRVAPANLINSKWLFVGSLPSRAEFKGIPPSRQTAHWLGQQV